ncbi:AAA family ATPase, partial [Nonomuraea sp. NN258]|uniref:AAA family ATPase n=1 Tax=Nonomuraea antri TaxID=2730852 RepID=UPI00156957A0
MRPHRLTLTAFGSFPGTETVDFDALAEAGLFLVHGPTGAGKTTVLDALCFALYGEVPGQRNSARSLRCDHAPATTGPAVTLEVSIRGRLLRIQRSPSWQRPKVRGSGFTEERAKVVVEERQGAGWQGLTTRLDEAGDLVGGLLGMNADQFAQVAMLPQGDFARFLRADGADRRKLLERLFTVKVFTQAETWLAEHRTGAWRRAQELRQQVDFALRRVEEAAGDDLLALVADGVETLAPEVPGPETEPLGWAGALLDAARAAVTRVGGRQGEAERAVRLARARFEQAAALAERQRRHAEALTRRRTLDERADERADLQAVLDDAARADRVLPLITAARQRAEAAAKAGTLVADALARARPLLQTGARASATGGGVSGADTALVVGSGEADTVLVAGSGEASAAVLAGLERERRAEIARLSELLTEEARLSVVRRDLLRVRDELAGLVRDDEEAAARLAVLPGLIEEAETGLAGARVAAAQVPAARAVRDAAIDLIRVERELDRLAADLDGLAQREAAVSAAEAELPERLATADARLAEVRAGAAGIPAAAAGLDAARSVLDACHRRDTLAADLEAAIATHQTLVDHAQGLRERWLDLRQARIDGMAAELARDLSDGLPCAVCGSDHHPHPASPAASAPSADDERAAESAHEAALSEREAAERALATIESRHADAVEATAGIDAETAAAAVSQAEEELDRLRSVAEREPALVAELERVEGERERVAEQALELAEALAEHRTHRSHLEGERARLRARLAPASADLVISGDDGEWRARDVLAAAESQVAGLEEVAAGESALAGRVARLGTERGELEERARRVAARLAASRTRHEELSGDAGRLTARLDAARGDDPTLTARLSRLSDEAELLREAVEATQAAAAARGELAQAERAAREAAAEAGFADAADAEAAARTPAEREDKAELLRRLDAEHAAVTGMLADPELVAAVAEPVPDLVAAEAERDAAEQAHTTMASARDRAESRARRLEQLHGELAACIERWQPAAERHRLAERIAALASGTSSDNQWNMSLSSFVLGERLRQVVDAANERLDHMSGGRYLLQHDLRKTAGSRARAGGGLGLRVADG